MRQRALLSGFTAVFVFVALTSCQRETPQAPVQQPVAKSAPPVVTPAPPPTPPPPPETSLGKLVSVERNGKTAVQVMTLEGVRNREITAYRSKTFLILHFEGKGRAHGGGMAQMVGMGEDRPMSMSDERSWLTDSQGKEYTPALLMTKSATAQISFEVPVEATGLVWHDGKTRAYRLEPHPVEMEETKTAAPTAKGPTH